MLAPYSGRNAGRHFLVTGGTQGVGLAIANRLAEEGAAGIILAGRNRERGEAAAAGLTAQGTDCRFAAADVGDSDDCQRLIETALAAFPTLDGLVNAAGTAERSGLLDTTLEQWDQHFNINARGPFLLMQGLVRHLLAGARSGSIVNIVSMAAHCGGAQVTPYSASKAALANLTRNTANAFAGRAIRCNAIMAGWMETPGDDAIQRAFHNRKAGWQKEVAAGLPAGRLADPNELAGLAAYLLSHESGVMTGALIDYDQNVRGA
ncbi:SDR family oxidoreductase (plasmid) [Sinorhizobium meliloti]|uniref:SDR family oxidoreductase n=1 Tax=Sinorhizobium TaxID=28105 RepID=UPI0011A10527|nr:SDR family oxidoreductase [Sinorhizobium medicae]MDX0009836.1 SDR family oxidoreductase [Sinorhizobium meliloti]MDX0227312.1 SDR family oxidoreductase [Sinorhizobium meliloti]TWA26377.1 NAD(P)-dependent dehydrogenase (short-subunit alcohol dehydrogenase family) [Sinorhizobium medicae]